MKTGVRPGSVLLPTPPHGVQLLPVPLGWDHLPVALDSALFSGEQEALLSPATVPSVGPED